MSKQRLRVQMRRAGVEIGPLDHITDLDEWTAAAEKLSDAEVVDYHAIVFRRWLESLSDDQLMRHLREVRAQCRES